MASMMQALSQDMFVTNERNRYTYKRKEKKIGRNDLCSCGSGKKYKKCCINKGGEDD